MTLHLRTAAYAPNGARLGVLPTPQALQGSMVLGDVGALSMAYPKVGPKAPWLAEPCEIALEVSWDNGLTWFEPDDARYLRLRHKGDQVDAPNVVTYEGPGYVWLLSKSKVQPEGLLNADGKRPFLSATVGLIMRTLIQEAQARGELPGLDTSTWTTAADSAGAEWGQVITLYYEPGLDYLTVLRNLSDQGMVDFTMSGRSLRLYKADTFMAGESGATLIKGRDLTEAPYVASLEDLATHAFLLGDEGVTLERTNPEVVGPWGRWTTFISQGGVSDPGTMTVLTDAALALGSQERVENTYGLAFSEAASLPFRDYALGREVAIQADNGPAVNLRLRSITLTRDTNGVTAGNIVVNDRFLENEVRQSRRITGITGGSALDGGSGARPDQGEDQTIPAAPAGLTAGSVAYLDDEGRTWAMVTLEWGEVLTNTDGTAADDLEGYEAWYRLGGLPDEPWSFMGRTDDTGLSLGQFQPDTTYEFRVRALDTSGHIGPFSLEVSGVTEGDGTPPGKPSSPIVTPYLGQLLLEWDGHLNGGGLPPLDFARAEFHLTTTNVAPAAGNVATLVSVVTDPVGGSTVATGLTYGATYYAWIILVDRTGNASVASDSVTGVPPKAASGDIESITANQITAGALLSAITVSGRIVAGALTGARVELNSAGLKAYDSTGALTTDVPSTGTGATFTGTLKTGFTGARAELKAATGQSVLEFYTGMVSETTPGRVFTTVTGSGAAADATLSIVAPSKNSLSPAFLVLASRDADTGADISASVYNGSYYWYGDPNFGAHHFRNNSTNVDWLTLSANGGTTTVYAPGILVMQSVSRPKIVGGVDISGGYLLVTSPLGEVAMAQGFDTSSFMRSDVIYNRTATFTANVGVAGNPLGVLYRITSSRRYKVEIQEQEVPLDALRALVPRSYVDRGEWEDAGEDATGLKRHLGLIAEEVAEVPILGDLLVPRDQDGQPGSVDYDRLAVALLPWLRTLEQRLDALESTA